MDLVLDYISNIWQVSTYTEDNKTCGYEINSYTNGGVNIGLFIDYRDTDLDVNNPKHFVKLLSKYIKLFDIDETIDMYREGDAYKEAFKIKDSVKDFEAYLKELKRIKRDLKAIVKGNTNNGERKNLGSLELKLATCERLGIDVKEMMSNCDKFASVMFDYVLSSQGDTNKDFNIITDRDFKKGSNLFALHNNKILFHGGDHYKSYNTVKSYLYDIYFELNRKHLYL